MEQTVNSNNAGFSLVEFLVALVILMVGMLGLLQAVNIAIQSNLTNQFRNDAVMMADDMMMKVRDQGFSNLVTGTSSGFVRRDLGNGFKNFSTQTSIVDITSDNDGARSREVDITVWWKHKNQRSQHILSSIVSKN